MVGYHLAPVRQYQVLAAEPQSSLSSGKSYRPLCHMSVKLKVIIFDKKGESKLYDSINLFIINTFFTYKVMTRLTSSLWGGQVQLNYSCNKDIRKGAYAVLLKVKSTLLLRST